MLEMLEQFCDDLTQAIPLLKIRRDALWKNYTTLGIGGKIPLLLEPSDDLVLSDTLKYCRENGIKTLLLGGGANICGSDEPFDGAVITITQGAFMQMAAGRKHISCGAGVRLSAFAAFAAKNGYGGLTALSGIPGSVGGALAMNAGAEGRKISDFVIELAGVYHNGAVWSAGVDELKWGYRKSGVPEGVIVTAAIFELPRLSQEEAQREFNDYIIARKLREPSGRSAGCAFRNPGSDTAGKLIDATGMKDVSVGGATVSSKHANFIINSQNASEHDFVTLLAMIRNQVAKKFGFYLRPEVVFANQKNMDYVMNSVKSPKVLVLCGGNSSEREISLRSGQAVASALQKAGYDIEVEDINECKITDAMKRADVIFPALHGGFGEGGRLQKLMEEAGIKFVGCGSAASMAIMDKIASKKIFDACGVSTAKWSVITPENREFPYDLKLPVVVKAPREGSSFGIKCIKKLDEWEQALDELFAIDQELLVEEFVYGVEISVPIVNGVVFPPVEIRPPHGFYDYDAKYVYKDGRTEYFCPAASLENEPLEKAKKYTQMFYRASNAKQLLRVDFIVDATGEPYALEGNSLPGLTATSLVPKSALVEGFSFEKLCVELILSALR